MRVTDVLYEADDPVDEERARALAVNEVLREPVSAALDDQRSTRRLGAAAAVAGVVLGIGAIAANVGVAVGAVLIVLGLAAGGGAYLYAQRQTPDVTVKSVDRGYWTGYTIPDEAGVVVYDATDSVETTSFDLERLDDEDAVGAVREELDAMGDFPVVMPHDRNVEAEFTRTLDGIKSEIENANRTTVEAPVVPASGPEAAAVEAFASRADEGTTVAADVEVDADDAEADVAELAELERMAATADGAAELEAVSERSRELVGELSGAHESAVDLLNNHIGTTADAFGLVSYNFYCPDCLTDEIDSLVELSDPEAGEWYCDTCRSHHETEAVVPRHRIKDDLVNPVWDQLWIEKDDERRRIYENIEDQKAELEEREFEQRSEEIRSSTDRIRDLRSRIRDLKTDAKASRGKVDEIGELMVKYDRIQEERKEAFRGEVEESFAEIDRKTDRILEETRNQEQERIDAAQKAAEEKAETMRAEKRRREAEMFMARQEREDRRTMAEMQQRGELHSEEMDMEKRHHRENWMIETRGGTGLIDRIDQFKMGKDRLPLMRATAYEGGDD
ncbi:hypothetical protein [Halosegnis marinus]|uniref:Uncharacterized protein n=1 Tax=Halosegnis marinus TaxID=3034023 RepID=A0ABD5ZQ23_9EURY|nr:hypothetical protein [Halosegnis sp. DT85]